MLADFVMRAKSSAGEYEVKYDDIIKELGGA